MPTDLAMDRNNLDLSWTGSRFRWFCRGEGPVLLLVGGQLMALEAWEDLAEDLGRFYRVLAIEFPNQGRSPTIPWWITVHHYGDFLIKFLEFQGVNPKDVVACGFSFGSLVLKALHLKSGVNFGALILAGSGSLKDKWKRTGNFDHLYELINQGRLEEFGRIYYGNVYGSTPGDGSGEQATMNLVESYKSRPEALLALIKTSESMFQVFLGVEEIYSIPVYLVAGLRDRVVDYGEIKDFAQGNSFPLYTLDCGHAMFQERPREAASILYEIMEKQELLEVYGYES